MKKIKILTITLAIIIITMIAFFGVYTQVQNRMENQIKEYEYDMDLIGSRNIRLKVNAENQITIKDSEGNIVEDSENLTDEEITEKGYTKEEIPYNSEEIKNIDNYKVSQKVIEKRLEKLGVQNYTIKLDEQTGNMEIELPENDETDSIISIINATGKFEITDNETGEVLLDNSNMKTAKVMYGSGNTTTNSGTTVYLEIEFNKESKKKLEEISNEYVKKEDTTTDENTTSENTVAEENTTTEENTATTNEKKVTMKIDDQEIMTTSFDEPIRTGKIQLSVGNSATDTDTLQGYIAQASSMANVLETGNIPVKYDLEENHYILSDITGNEVETLIYIVLGIMVVALIILLIRYKSIGALGVISYIGLVSLLMIVIRYTNVILSLEGLLGFAIIGILNYMLVNQLLAKVNDRTETYKQFFIKIVPVIIMAIILCFVSWTPISSFGMVMFWGIVLMAVYNGLVTNGLLKINAGKEK